MTLAAVVLVVRYGVDVPLWDDFALVPVLTGEKPLTVSWLWAQHNESRIALSKLVLLGAYHLAGFDFRAGMFINVAALAALAWCLISIARRLCAEARAVIPDHAFFPIVLLNWGLHADLLWSIQVVNVLAVTLAGFLLLLILAHSSRPGPGRTSLMAVLLVLLSFNGAIGPALVPPFCGWFLALAASHWRSREPRARRSAFMILALMTPALAVTLLYFRGYRSPSHDPIEGGIASALRTAVQFLGIGFGPPAAVLWPWSGFLVIALFLTTLALTVHVLARRSEERLRALGILCFFAANVLLAAGVGWGRAAAGELKGRVPGSCRRHRHWPCRGSASPLSFGTSTGQWWLAG